MKKEVCLICVVCFFLGYFVADVVSKCGFGREHYESQFKGFKVKSHDDGDDGDYEQRSEGDSLQVYN